MARTPRLMARPPRWAVRAMDLANRKGKSVGVRLVRYTGKSRHFVHPKHLIEGDWHDWYLDHLRPTDVVLDVGCGNGAHAVRAARACRFVAGGDYDPRSLRVAAQTRVGARAAFFAGDMTGTLPFRDRTFDAVLFLDVIEHVHPRVAVLREISRVLKDGGRLMVSGPNRDTTWRRRLREAGLFSFSDPDHKVEYTADEFVAELQAGGFTPEGPLAPVVYDTPWAGVIDAVGGISLALYARLSRWKRQTALRRPDESTGFRAIARKRPGATA